MSRINAAPGAVDFTLAHSGYVSPPRDALDYAIAYSSAWPRAVDFKLTDSGYVSPPRDAVDFSWDDGPPTPQPDVSQLYRNVRARWQTARRRSSRPVQSGYRSSPRVDDAAVLRHAAASVRVGAVADSGWGRTDWQDRAAGPQWSAAKPLGLTLGASWHRVGARDIRAADTWNAARPLDRFPTFSLWLRVYPRDARSLLLWDMARPPAQTVRPPQYVVQRRGIGLVNPRGGRLMTLLPEATPRDWQAVQLHETLVYVPAQTGAMNFMLDAGDAGDVNFTVTGRPAYTPPPAKAIETALEPRYAPPLPLDIRTRLGIRGDGFELVVPAPYVQQRRDPFRTNVPWGTPPERQISNVLPWGPQGRYPGRDPIIDLPWIEDPAAPPPQPPALRVHVVLNSVSVVRLPDRTPIDVDTVDLSSNVESAYWTLRMTLADPGHVALLRPTVDGPAQVEVDLNGYVWTAIIEGREGNREFANRGVTVIGRSRTAVLDDPYAPQRSATESEIRTARQLAEAELTNTGFTLDWAGVDWLVPGGAWYYQNLTPMAVLQRIAAARGAVIQSHPSELDLRVRSRYPASPWAWNSTVADIVLPGSWVTNESARLQSRPLFDAVIVSGEQQGVLGRITRAGSAGETFAEQVVDQLITEAAVAAERGRVVLGDRGEQELVDMRIPLFVQGEITGGGPGLYTPLQLIEVQDVGETWKGLGVGVTISARRAGTANAGLEIWQNVSIERHLTDAS